MVVEAGGTTEHYYIEAWCEEGHWDGLGPENPDDYDPWKDCADFKEVAKYETSIIELDLDDEEIENIATKIASKLTPESFVAYTEECKTSNVYEALGKAVINAELVKYIKVGMDIEALKNEGN
jgi:hypothetical protein